MSWSLGPFTFHAYGLIVGLAIVVGYSLVERKLLHLGINRKWLEKVAMIVVLGAVVGARGWHVITDWRLYQHQWWSALAVWQGGLSILGAVGGGGVALWWATRRWPQQGGSVAVVVDAAVFGLPWAQTIGRVGNWINQELYGLPTTLPWAITIQGRRYHPLFAYEMIAVGVAGVIIWWWDSSTRRRPLGSGWYAWSYLWYYAGVRFLLDFLRIDKALFWGVGLGINQVVLVGVWVVASYQLIRLWQRNASASS